MRGKSGDSPPVAPGTIEQEVEQHSWFFYLAEISIRRTIGDTISLIYSPGEDYWMHHIDHVCNQSYEAKKQIYLHQKHLPPSLRFDDKREVENELSYYMQGRFAQWHEFVFRPLLYYAIHKPSNDPMPPDVLKGAQEALDSSDRWVRHFSDQTRHGGTWFIVRLTFSCSIIILAVVIRAGDVRPPADWPSLIRRGITTISQWRGEAPDVEKMTLLLKEVFMEACRRRGYDHGITVP